MEPCWRESCGGIKLHHVCDCLFLTKVKSPQSNRNDWWPPLVFHQHLFFPLFFPSLILLLHFCFSSNSLWKYHSLFRIDPWQSWCHEDHSERSSLSICRSAIGRVPHWTVPCSEHKYCGRAVPGWLDFRWWCLDVLFHGHNHTGLPPTDTGWKLQSCPRDLTHLAPKTRLLEMRDRSGLLGACAVFWPLETKGIKPRKKKICLLSERDPLQPCSRWHARGQAGIPKKLLNTRERFLFSWGQRCSVFPLSSLFSYCLWYYSPLGS